MDSFGGYTDSLKGYNSTTSACFTNREHRYYQGYNGLYHVEIPHYNLMVAVFLFVTPVKSVLP